MRRLALATGPVHALLLAGLAAVPAPSSARPRVATKAKWPDPITGVSDVAGPGPGETTIHWTSGGS